MYLIYANADITVSSIGPKTNSRSSMIDRVLYQVQNEGNDSINIIIIIIPF